MLPATLGPVRLRARFGDREVQGQVAIAQAGVDDRIREVGLRPADAQPPTGALEAIARADQIVLAPGSLYTSIVAVLSVDELRAAIAEADASVVQVANLATENETRGHDGTDHLAAVRAHGGRVDVFLYDPEHGLAVDPAAVAELGTKAIGAPISRPDGTGHDPRQLAKALAGLRCSRRTGTKETVMAVRVGINGFGRIGRSFTCAILARGEQAEVELVAINDPFGDADTMAFLLKHDSVGGTIGNEIKAGPNGFSIDGREVKKLESREPGEIPWADNGVDVVIESTGLFTSREKAGEHLKGGAKRVVISAPAADADVTICMGVNDDKFDPKQHTVISNVVVHHELPRTAREGAQRQLRHRVGLDDDRARVHHRPTAARPGDREPLGQARPASHARRRTVDHPELHGCREGDRAGVARPQRQAQRHGAARTGAHGFDHRPDGDAR